MSNITIIIMGAGKGTRMKSSMPKIMETIAGIPLAAHVLKVCDELNVAKTIFVVSKEFSDKNKKELESIVPGKYDYVIQDPPLGTGHAVLTAIENSSNLTDEILILCGDMPVLTKDSIRKLTAKHRQKRAVISFLTTHLENAGDYGRVVRGLDGRAKSIIEAKEASSDMRKIKEVNAGIYFAKLDFLKKSLKHLKAENSQKEYYLTDLIKLACNEDLMVGTVQVDPEEGLGVNNFEDLSRAEAVLYKRKISKLKSTGVYFSNENNISIDSAVEIGKGTRIMGPCYLFGNTSIGQDSTIEPGVFIRDSFIMDNVCVRAYSYIDQVSIAPDVQIGPFAHLRPGTDLGPGSKVGNFVEIKKSKIGAGSKINHLSYIGDALIGKDVNVGAGTITCNYDGVNKHQTILEDGVFVGSDTQFVAPVKVGKNATIGAGSTITTDVPSESLALSRSKQIENSSWKKPGKPQ